MQHQDSSLDGLIECIDEPELIDEPDIDQQDNEYDHIKAAVAEASKGVSAGTHREYTAQRKSFEKFVVAAGWVVAASASAIIGPDPHVDTPTWIAAWIMNKCDDRDYTGRVKRADEERGSHAYAQKMRASMTYFYGQVKTIGQTPWHHTAGGKGVGNPSISHPVASYMKSLRRRKVAGGETPMSAKAITPDVLRMLWDFNHRPENWYLSGDPVPLVDGSPGSRRLLQAAYTLAFVCLLRFDEVLKIQSKHLVAEGPEGARTMKLTLSYRKTNQFGGVQPFYLHRFHDSEAHLCPVRALSEWLSFYKPNLRNPDEYIFPALANNGMPMHGTRLSSEMFLELFRNNLSDISIDNTTYGTHSFRRGGCQWLSCDKRWPLRQICDWGGWSTEFNSLTIVKYLVSCNDDPREKREDLLNPNRPLSVRCPLCGRTCTCS